MAYRVTKIVYASHPNTLQAGGVPHQQTLLIFGVEGTGSEVLLWQGYRVPITPSEWEGSTSGGVTTKSWGGSFTKGYGATAPDQLKNLSPVDTSTASVSANISYASNSTIGYVLAFTYAAPGAEESEEYTVYLGNYVNSEIRLCTPRTEGGTQIYQTYDFVPAEVGISSNGEAESSAEYGTTASYRRAVVNEWVMLESFDVQLTGPKQFTATYSGRCYLDPNVHSSFDAISFRLYVTELDANGDAAETGSYGLPVTASNGNTEFSGSLVLTDIANQLDYDLATKYKFYVVASIDAEEAATSAEIQRWTQRKLPAPTVSGWLAQDGAGYVSWGAVENAAGYEIAVVDSASAVPVSGSAAASPWNFNETTSGTAVQDKYVRLKSVAVSNQYEYATSEWSAGVLITGTRTPEEEEPVTPVEINMTRRIYKAIPYVDVPVEQIGANGSSPKDVITVEYANAHYVQSGGEIPASQLPIATSENLGAIKVGSHLSINAETGVLRVTDTGAIANGNTGLVTGGAVYAETHKYAAFADKSIATSVSSGNSNPVTSGAVYTFVTDAGNLPKAKADGGAGNAGVVYVTSASDKEGLIIDGTNDGQIKVDFATYSSWSSTVANKVANPSYVKQAIEGYVADTTKVTATGGSGKGGMIVKLNGDGFIDGSMLKVVSVTNYFEAASQSAMLALSDAQDGDICVRTDEHKTYILMSDGANNGYATLSNWKELTAPTGTVTSVNGKAGAAVTLSLTDIYANGSTKATIDTSIAATAIGTENYHFPTSKAVQGYVTGLGYQTASQVSTAISVAGATWTVGTSTWGDTGNGYVSVTYLKNALNNYDSDVMTTVQGMLDSQTHVSVDITDSISAGTGITSTAAGLVQGKAVYEYAAPASHKHGLGDITYSGATGYSAGTTISSSSTDGQLATAKAVYDYQPLITRVQLDATNGNFAGVYHNSNTAPSLSTDNKYLATAYSVLKWIADAVDDVEISVTAQYGLTYTNKTLAITRANGTGTYGTVVQSSSANGLTITNGVIAPTWASYATTGDRTSTVKFVNPAYVNAYIADQSSVTGAAGKLVKFDADGYIDAFAILCDDQYLYVVDGQSETGIGRLTIDRDQLLNGMASQTWANQQYVKQGAIAPVWSSSGTYVIGDVVEYNGKVYRKTTTGDSATSPNMVGSGWTETPYASTTKYTGTITGDGTTTSFDVTHNLGVTDVDVTLIDNNTGQEVYAAVTMVSSSVVRIGFGAAPASGKKYRVVVRK